jgi:predicted transcriptional regulator
MPEISFLVEGSASDPYEVIFLQTDSGLSALCSCKAGQNGQHCKHRTNIMRGSVKELVEQNPADLETLRAWLSDSELGKALERSDAAEVDLERAKKEATAAKKALARAMK